MSILKSRSFRYVSGYIAAGIVITILVAYVERNILQTYKQSLPYISLGDNLKNRTTKGHLWFEEIMAGDNSINFEKDVLPLFTSSQDILQKAYDRKETELGAFTSSDEETLAILKEAINDVENLTNSAKSRWDFKNERDRSSNDSTFVDTGEAAGGKLDQEFDASYEELQSTFDRMIVHVSGKVNSASAFLSLLSWISLVLIGFILAALCYFVFRSMSSNEKLSSENKLRLETELVRVTTLSGFIEAISNGNFSITLDGSDDLSNKLITMRDTLKINAEQDQRRNWATSGIAQIGEILRNAENTTHLYDSIINFVVKYTKSNQGGMFLLNDENEGDHYLELVSCYAFERKKFITKRVSIGAGLVGQCYLEGTRIHIRQLPEDYVHITSGLGGANPTSLLVIPMKVNDKMFGVLELASFKKYEEHEIELVEKFAESIGAEVSSVKINESTRILLEKTQQQAEEMRAQEEEMRQNMEELEATQEEMRRKEKHVQDLLDTERTQREEASRAQTQLMDRERVLSLTTILSESDATGTIIFANDKLCEVSKYSQEELLGRSHNLFRHPDMPKELFKLLWDTIKSKQVFKGVVKNRAKDGTHYWVDAVIMPVYQNGIFMKYISARYHIKDDSLAKEMYNKQAVSLGLPILP